MVIKRFLILELENLNKIVEILKCKKVNIPKRPGEPSITHANPKLALRELNWKHTINIKDGINLVLKDINFWKNAPLWSPAKIKVATSDWFKYLK